MEYCVASIEDIPSILSLHNQYQVDTIKEEDKKDGFVTTAFTEDQLRRLIELEQGIFIAKEGDKVIAYVMSASWQFWCEWPMFRHMVDELPNTPPYKGQMLSVENSYQYGPVCVDKQFRGQGILEALFRVALEAMSKKYAVLATFINKKNPRSFVAHTQKIKLDVLREFSYNNNEYYWLVCLTNNE